MTRFHTGRPADDAELRSYMDARRQAFLGSREDIDRALEHWVFPDEVTVVRAGSRLAGGLQCYRMGQWFGGRSVPMAGIAGVAIFGEHRARGAASALMRAALDEIHAAGLPISTLYPATQPVYRRVGYELAGQYLTWKVPIVAIDVRDRTLELQPIEKLDDTLTKLYTSRAHAEAGHLERPQRFWDRIFEARGDAAVFGYAAGAEGYVVLEQRRDKGFRYDLRVRDLVASTPAAARRLLTLFADHRSMAENVYFTGAPADPLLHLLAEQPYALDFRFLWMVRLVDVRGALQARGYPAGVRGELHLDVRDDVLPWNHGRWVLEIADGRGRVRKGGRGRVKADVRGLAALYTGHMGAGSLRATGQIEASDKDAGFAQSAFAGPAPWLPDFF